MITHQHPAVLAAHTAAGSLQSVPDATWVHGLTAALPHLLREVLATERGQALLAEVWKAGYQARQNDLGAADTTPCPYPRTHTAGL